MFRKLKERIVESPVFPGIVLIMMGMIPIVHFIIFFDRKKGYYLPFVGAGFLVIGFGIYALIIGIKEAQSKK